MNTGYLHEDSASATSNRGNRSWFKQQEIGAAAAVSALGGIATIGAETDVMGYEYDLRASDFA